MNKSAIQRAAESLDLAGVVQVSQDLTTDVNRYIACKMKAETELKQQTAVAVKFWHEEYETEDGDSFQTVIVNVTLGVRLIDDTDQSDANSSQTEDEGVWAKIEASFLVEYLVVGAPPKESDLNEFANFNAVHNVWPFWREIVFRLTRAAALPDIIVPLYRNGKLGEVAGKKGDEADGIRRAGEK